MTLYCKVNAWSDADLEERMNAGEICAQQAQGRVAGEAR